MPSVTERALGRRLRSAVMGPGAIALLVVLVLIVLAPRLSFIEVRALDFLYALMPSREPDPRIETIDVGNDPSVFDRLRDPRDSCDDDLEVPRRAYTEAVRRLSRWGARVIVFDLMFARKCQHEDEELAEAFRDAGNVVVAATTKTKPDAVRLEDPVMPLGDSVWAVGSPAAIQPNATVRSIPLMVRDDESGDEYPALSLLAFQRYMGVNRSDIELSEGRWLLTAQRKVPLLEGERIHLLPPIGASDAGGSGGGAAGMVEVVKGGNIEEIPGLKTWNALLVNWVGPEDTIRPRLLDEALAIADDAQGRGIYEGKAVIVGRAEWDVHWTAVGAMAGPEIQANALQTLLSGAFIRPISPWVMLALLAVFAFAAASAVRQLRGARAIGAALLLMLIAAILARQLLAQRGIWMYLFYCDLGIGLAWAMATVAESGKVTALLARFVPSFMGRAAAPVQGEVRTLEASILFSDIRGYTGTAEQLSAGDTLTMLNAYHSAVEDIITAHGGTIVKTPGDAVLAVFWRELRGVNHAGCALRAGREILADLPAHARTWEAAGVRLQIGIGINAGSVAIGMVGKRHLEPTVIGDAVNVAQRLESLTKTLGYPLIYSESVHTQLREDFGALSLDEVTVAGRKAPVRIYGLASAEGSPRAPEQGVDRTQKERTE